MAKEVKKADEWFDRGMVIIKKSLRNIKQSYNNYWDVLAELLQNSVDGIIRRNRGHGKIQIQVNAKKKSITVKDDGEGIPSSKLDNLLNPFSSDKEDLPGEAGENGVGVSFVIFQSNDFTIKTHYANHFGTKTAKITNASKWCSDDENDDFCESDSIQSEKFEGTEVTVKENDDERIFDLSLDQLKYLLRTKTAIGNVNEIYDKTKIDIEVELTYVDKTGKNYIEHLPFKYLTPIDGISNKILYKDAIEYLEDEYHSELDKKMFINNRIIYNHDHHQENGIDFDFWSCYVPDREVWKKISKKYKLIDDNEDNENSELQFHSGITLSTKGMPTGIELPQPSGLGNAGYFPNFFIIINDDSYVPDIGRKAISEDKKKIYISIAKKQFNSYATKIAPFFKQEKDDEFDIAAIEEEIKSLPKINSNIIKYKCAPHDQEAGVAAIFYELIGSKKAFTNFYPYYSAYRNKYDLYGKYKNKLISLEFKYHLKNIISDFKNYTKMANEINYIVCWNVSEEDEAKLNSVLKTDIIKCNLENYDKNSKYMPEVTHCMSYSNCAKPIYVIDLKIILEILNKDENAFISK